MARMTLDELVRQLAQVHGEHLRCVLLYGSAVGVDEAGAQSDRNVLVLVDRIDPRQLETLGATVRAWMETGSPPPFELTVDEWHRSADIFPMEYADILARHRVLHGALPPALPVDRANLRRQAEYEATGKVLRLRQAIMHAGTDGRRQVEVLRASHGTLMAIFRATLRVAGEEVPAGRDALIERVAQRAGLDPAPFARVHADRRGDRSLTPADAEPVLIATLAQMEALARWLDTAGTGTGPA
jgi:hypothetical protein